MFKIIYVIVVIIGMALVVFCDRIYEKVNKNTSVIENFKKLHIKDNVYQEVKKFYYEKFKLIGAVCLICGCVGLIYCIKADEDNQVIKIDRPYYDEGSEEHSIKVIQENGQTDIKLNITPREYTEYEAKDICDRAFSEWKEVFCGTNKSLDNICSNVVLSDTISEYGVSFEYYIDKDSYIDYEGNILTGEAKFVNGECKGHLLVICSIGDYKFDYSVSYIITEPEKTIEKVIQEDIDRQDKYSDSVELPEIINSEKVSYYSEKNSNSHGFFIVIAVTAAIAIYIGKDRDLSKEIKEREEQLRYDYAEIVSVFSLLQQTGQSIRNSWNKITDNYKNTKNKRYIYAEMKLVKSKIENGISERQAYREFGRRCGTQEYIRLANIIEQNLSKGSNSIRHQLELEVSEASRNKIAFAKQKAEECSTKMLVPMIMMLIIVMAILLIPAFMNMNI